MKVIILGGGLGTRLADHDNMTAKPMVEIGGKPILMHIMRIFASFDHKDFYIALGYKSELIKEYFLNYRNVSSDITVNLGTGTVTSHNSDDIDWKVTLVHTGIHSMTGGRAKRLQRFIGDETCMLTYGDGLADINLDKLVKFHKSHGKLITVSAVHPGARFGELTMDGERVRLFREKPQTETGWINGGFFVIEPGFFDLLTDDSTILEREPLENAAQKGELMAYKHEKFWQCMDTKRDRDKLEELWQNGDPPWIQ